MVIKISGEQPFQVLSTTFTIGPSTSGYDLYFSADGVNYTQLFTVSAGVNRQVTQVAAGSYYKLVGNTGNVTVNWYGNCVVDSGSGGGGGTYVLPVASQNTLGGIKVGSGLTIDANGVLSSNGGGGSNNYVITEDLSAITTPVEGMIAYVPSHVVSTITGTRIQISDFEHFTENTEGYAEGYIARVHWLDWTEGVDGVDDKIAVDIYQSGREFYWDWDNSGELNDRQLERDGTYYTIKYQTHNGNDGNGSDSYFDFYDIDNTGFIIKISDYVGGQEISQAITEPTQKYIYNGTEWVKFNDFHYLYIGEYETPEATVADRVNLYNTIAANPDDDYSIGIIFDGGLYRFRYLYRDGEGRYIFTAMLGIRRVGFGLTAAGDVNYVHDDTPSIPQQGFITIDTGGTVTDNGSLYQLSSEQIYRIWVKCDYDSVEYPGEATDTAYAPLKYCYRQYENINDEMKLVYYLGADINIGGTVYSGTWYFKEYEAGETPLAADTWVAQQ